MTARLPLAVGLLLGGITALAIDGPAAPVALALDSVDDAIDRFEERMKNAETNDKKTAIAELGLKKDPRVAKALTKWLRDPDDDVRIAVCQVIGKQKEPSVAGALIFIAEDKKNREKPKLVAAAVEAVGDVDPKRHYKFLHDVAKKQLDYNGDIAAAAIRSIAGHVTADTVDDLMKELDRTNDIKADMSAEKQAARNACKPVIIDCLKKMTGENISDPKVWREWWSDNKKTWKPRAPGEVVDVNASDTYEDSAYGFKVTKPSKAWTFKRVEGEPYIHVDASEDGMRAAWVEIVMQGTKNLASKTPSAMAEEMKGKTESKLRDLKEDSYWGKKIRFAGESACEDKVFGRHSDYDAAELHNVYVEKDGIMFNIYCVWKSGRSAALRDDIDRILDSFKFTR